jgi:hypothetical protein
MGTEKGDFAGLIQLSGESQKKEEPRVNTSLRGWNTLCVKAVPFANPEKTPPKTGLNPFCKLIRGKWFT